MSLSPGGDNSVRIRNIAAAFEEQVVGEATRVRAHILDEHYEEVVEWVELTQTGVGTGVWLGNFAADDTTVLVRGQRYYIESEVTAPVNGVSRKAFKLYKTQAM